MRKLITAIKALNIRMEKIEKRLYKLELITPDSDKLAKDYARVLEAFNRLLKEKK